MEGQGFATLKFQGYNRQDWLLCGSNLFCTASGPSQCLQQIRRVRDAFPLATEDATEDGHEVTMLGGIYEGIDAVVE